MSIFSLSQILALYTWFPLVVLLALYLLIARFYQRFSGRRTYFRLYPLPMIAYGVSFVRYASADHLAGDLWGDAFGALGGGVLLYLTTFLFVRMIRNAHR